MIAKTVLAAAALASTIAVAAPAQAGVDIDVGIGLGGFYPAYDAPIYIERGHGHHIRPRHLREDFGISCGEGREIVADAGFRNVRPRDCGGRRYAYKAKRHGETFIVKVNRRGSIVSVQEIF